MLSRLEKAEKTPSKGWKTNSLVEYSSDEDEVLKNSQSSSQEDEVLLLDIDDKNTENTAKKHKSPLEYTREAKYKIPKRTHTSLPNGTHTDSSVPTSADRYRSMGFDSSFSRMRRLHTRNTIPSTRSTRDVQFRLQRQTGDNLKRFTINRTFGSPRPNLNAARTRKSKGAFEDEINMQMHVDDMSQDVTKNTRNATKDKTTNHHKPDNHTCKRQTELEISSGESDVTEGNNRLQVILKKVGNVDLHVGRSDRRKQELPRKMENEKCKDFAQNNSNKSKNKTPTKLEISSEDSCPESEKNVDYFVTSSLKAKNTNKKDEQCEASVDTPCERHVFASSKATPRPPLHQNSNSTNSEKSCAESQSSHIKLDSNIPKKTNSSTGKQGEDSSSVQSDNDSDHSDYVTQPSTDATNDNDNKNDGSNKNLFYNLAIKTYGLSKDNRFGVKRLSCIQNGNKKRSKRTDNDDSSVASREQSEKKKSLRTNKTQKKSGPKVSLVEIISSDEEEKAESKSTNKSANDTPASDTSEMSIKSTAKDTRSTRPKPAFKTVNENPFQRDVFNEEIQLGQRVFLGCLQVKPCGPLEISVDNLKWKMEHNEKTVTLMVRPQEFTCLKIHVDNDPKIIVLEVAQCLALRIRERFAGNGKFIDPGSPVSGEKDIVFEVDDNLKPELIADLSEWVTATHGKQFEELSQEDADKLFACYSSHNAPKGSRYNTRSTSTKTVQSTVTPTKLIIYPRPPNTGAITVTSADLECLATGEFLNDVIIDFYLKYIYYELLDDTDRERTYIFSTYFYKRLTHRMSSDQASTSDNAQSYPERMHNKVKKWTRNVDIFEKDFIIIPINESSHWFLAIICFPNLVNDAVAETNDLDDSQQCVEVVKSSEEDSQETLSTESKTSTNSPIAASPCILLFDSLGSSSRSRVYTNIRNYLTCEWKSKKPNEPARDFTKDNIKGSFPKVPHQENHCDCGVFVLEYVLSFFKDPIKDYRLPINKKEWFTQEDIYSKREEIKDLIVCLSNEDTTSLCNNVE